MKRAVALASSVVLASACSGSGEIGGGAGATTGAGRVRVVATNDGRDITLLRDDEVLLRFGADAFQIGYADAIDPNGSYDPYALDQRGDDAAGVTYRSPQRFAIRDVGDGAFVVSLDYAPGSAELFFYPFVRAGVKAVRFDFETRDETAALARIRAKPSGDPREGFYGLGEWQDSVDHRGKLRPMQIEPDPSLESGYNEAHVPVPFLVGTHGWGIFAESKRTGAFDVLRKDPSVVEITFAIASDRPDAVRTLSGDLFASDAPIDLVKSYYAATGAPKLPAPWALGPWIWRNENKDQAEVEDDIATIRKLDLATSAIWIDRPYATAVNTFDFDPAKFSAPQKMIDRAHAAGLEVALWSTPYLEPATGTLIDEANAKHFFPPRASLPLNKWGTPIDFTNPEARAFWTDLVKRYTSMGIAGFKLDYGEDIAPSLGLARNPWGFADGSDERTMHHDYSALYHAAYSDALPPDRFVLARAAHWGEQTLGMVIWPGDMDATFGKHGERFTPRDETSEITGVGGLPATVVMGLSLGVSGFPFFGADTGGYRHGPPDAELYVRWFEQTALSSVMQVGDADSQPPWVFTPENGRGDHEVDVYRTYARLHMRLFPYEWTLATRIPIDGRPIQRPIGLAYPELGVHPSDEYLFGDDLLVAPVVTRGERRRHVVLPRGTWIDFWDAAPFVADASGGADVDAPLEKLPLFLREGAIVPMLRPTIDTLTRAEDPAVESFVRDPGSLWVLVAPGPPRAFTLWDGTSIERAPSGEIALAGGTVFTKGFVLEIVATASPTEVTRDGIAIANVADVETATEGWSWTPDRRGTLRVKVASSGRIRVR